MRFLNGTVTGIDFGSKAIKLAECRFKGGNPEVVNAFSIELPDDYAQDTYFDLALDAMVRTRKSHKISLSNVAIICPKDLLEVFNVVFPAMPKNELYFAMQRETKRVSNLDPENINFDYCPNIEKEGGTEYLVYYAEKRKINSLVAKFKKYGINVSYIDVEDMVYLACFKNIYTDDGSTKGFFDIGYSQSGIILANNGVQRFNKKLNYNLKTVYDRLKTENFKDGGYKDVLEIKGLKDETVNRVLTKYLSELLYDISKSIDHFMTNCKLSPPTNIFLSGGIFRIPGVYEFVQKNLGYSTTLNNVLDVAGYKDQSIAMIGFTFNLAVGVALR
jgi:Tfp pilus assembly PilM family ATPase